MYTVDPRHNMQYMYYVDAENIILMTISWIFIITSNLLGTNKHLGTMKTINLPFK